jgi:hypothetical protein
MITALVPLGAHLGSTELSSMLALRVWLSERWAILFSHPCDFDREELERERWLSVLSRSFREHRVQAIALARPVHDTRAAVPGWLAELGDGCAATLSIVPTRGAAPQICGSGLPAQISGSDSRVVIIIDPDLRCRRTLRYRAALDAPSPLELLGWAVALRERDSRRERQSGPVAASAFPNRFRAARVPGIAHRPDGNPPDAG